MELLLIPFGIIAGIIFGSIIITAGAWYLWEILSLLNPFKKD